MAAETVMTDPLPPHLPRDARESARAGGKPVLPKRFYREAAAQEREGGFAILLDGKPVSTPGRRRVLLPNAALAELVVAEWAGQGALIDPATMPVTRICNSAIEGVADEMEAVADEIVRFAGSDLMCYRAGEPASLVAAQAQAWDPVLDWAREKLGARLMLAQGIVHVAQLPEALAAVRAGLARCAGADTSAPFRLAALSVITSLTGSALLALQCGEGGCTPEQAWAAAHVDEDFQAKMWGPDEEAQARRAARWQDMAAAGQVLASLTTSG